MIKNIFILYLSALILQACSKENNINSNHPLMNYKDLADSTIMFGRSAAFDVDNNGEPDIYFTTQLIGDPINQQDKKQWMVNSSINTNLPVNASENIPVLMVSENIPMNNFNGYNWYNASSVLLVQQVISLNAPPYWEGAWKQADHRYIPFQIKRSNKVYNGWFEVSFNTTAEKLILHKAAISTQGNRDVKAGL